MNYRWRKWVRVHSIRPGKFLKRPKTALKMNELPLGEVTGGFIQTAQVSGFSFIYPSGFPKRWMNPYFTPLARGEWTYTGKSVLFISRCAPNLWPLTNGQTDKQMLQSTLSPCFAVDSIIRAERWRDRWLDATNALSPMHGKDEGSPILLLT